MPEERLRTPKRQNSSLEDVSFTEVLAASSVQLLVYRPTELLPSSGPSPLSNCSP